jgi:hypothetical protein
MKTVITIKEARYNGEDKPIGTKISMDNSLANDWIFLGLAEEYKAVNPLIFEDSIKKQNFVKKNNGKKVPKNA